MPLHLVLDKAFDYYTNVNHLIKYIGTATQLRRIELTVFQVTVGNLTTRRQMQQCP